METSGLYTLAAMFKFRALSVLTVRCLMISYNRLPSSVKKISFRWLKSRWRFHLKPTEELFLVVASQSSMQRNDRSPKRIGAQGNQSLWLEKFMSLDCLSADTPSDCRSFDDSLLQLNQLKLLFTMRD